LSVFDKFKSTILKDKINKSVISLRYACIKNAYNTGQIYCF